MPSTGATTKRNRKKRTSQPRRQPSNVQLLKLAAKRRPPQAWYDDPSDPTQPVRNGRGR